MTQISDPVALTPIDQVGDIYIKRDDLFSIGGSCGGKVRACLQIVTDALASGTVDGLITAGSRQSPQVNIVATIAEMYDLPCRVHTPQGEMTPELHAAVDKGAEIVQHQAGYNNVIIARARDDAKQSGWLEIPFGMAHHAIIASTAAQISNIPADTRRIVVPVGSGMALAGILTGLQAIGRDIPVIGVRVGADPSKRLDLYAPSNWRQMATLITSEIDYHHHAPVTHIGDIDLDPIYEAKALPYLTSGDLLWVVGRRETARSRKSETPTPKKVSTMNIRPEISDLSVPLDQLRTHPKNIRQGDIGAICTSLEAHGQYRPIVVQRSTGHILAGNHTYQAARSLGWSHVAATYVECDDEQALRILLVDNRANDLATYDDSALSELLRELAQTDIGLTGTLYDGDALDELITNITKEWEERTPLVEQFGVPPFSVLDTRQGYWRTRKENWLKLGIESEIGRDDDLARSNKTFIANGTLSADSRLANGTSIFDPVLTELLVRWFSPPQGTVIDPFAGGSVRGIVTALLDRTYHGIDLRSEQIIANIRQAQQIITGTQSRPNWVVGDSRNIIDLLGSTRADFILTCPPYGSLEQYSDDPRDLSAMTPDDFIDTYRQIIRDTVALLRDDSFAAIVVGDYRDKHGYYHNFVSQTIDAALSAGLHLYNEAILVNMIGTGAMVAGTYMRSSRKLVKLHQNVLIFVKGDPKQATLRCGDIDMKDDWQSTT
jgi:1-aminocyclopropane-1-carboxylate deaminase/D-cysteine desulfhydrase-like pyridoxal-dependent ACC family enzyme